MKMKPKFESIFIIFEPKSHSHAHTFYLFWTSAKFCMFKKANSPAATGQQILNKEVIRQG